MTDPAARYRARFDAVLARIEAHADEDIDTDRLAESAAFSRWHFTRQFAALYGMSPATYLRIVRMDRAAHALAYRPRRTVTHIALASGYASLEAFSRAFRLHTGQSPTAFRRDPCWERWQSLRPSLTCLRTNHMPARPCSHDVSIELRPSVRIALLIHRGDPARLPASIATFIAWRRANGLPPHRSATYNLLYDDPAQVEPRDYRFGLAAAIANAVADNDAGIVEDVIAGGRCAVLRHVGSDDTLGQAAAWLYGQWLPASGETLRDVPLHLQRIRFFPDVPAMQAVTDILLPLR